MTVQSRIALAAAATVCGGLLLAGAEANACGNGKILFEDRFGTVDPAWGFTEQDTTRSNGPEGLVYKLDFSREIDVVNQSGLYGNYEVCAEFTTEATAETNEPYIAVSFWAVDANNQYSAIVFPKNGTFAINRYQNRKRLSPVSVTSNGAIHQGTSVKNEISVTVNGNRASLAINDKKIIDFNGQPPEGGSLIGFTLGTSKQDPGPTTFTLESMQVREVVTAPGGNSR